MYSIYFDKIRQSDDIKNREHIFLEDLSETTIGSISLHTKLRSQQNTNSRAIPERTLQTRKSQLISCLNKSSKNAILHSFAKICSLISILTNRFLNVRSMRLETSFLRIYNRLLSITFLIVIL